MSTKEVDVTCPTCRSRLSVDVLTQKVLRCREPEDAGPHDRAKAGERGWDSALGRVSGRMTDGADRFDASLKREQRRGKDLDDLFEELGKKDRTADDEEQSSDEGGAK